MRTRVEPAHQAAFHPDADAEQQQRHGDECSDVAVSRRNEPRGVRADHEQRAVREVDDPQRTEDQREAQRNQREHRADLQPRQQHQREFAETHRPLSTSAGRKPGAAGGGAQPAHCASSTPRSAPCTARELARKEGHGIDHFVARHVLDDVEEIVFVLHAVRALAAHDQDVVERLVIAGTVQHLAVAGAFELEVLERLDDFRRVEGAGALDGVRIEQRLHVRNVRGLRRRMAVPFLERLRERLRCRIVEMPAPLGRPVDALDVLGAGAFCHQPAVQRHDDLHLLAVHLAVAHPEANRLRQRIHHVLAIVIEDQHVGVAVQHGGQVRS